MKIIEHLIQYLEHLEATNPFFRAKRHYPNFEYPRVFLFNSVLGTSFTVELNFDIELKYKLMKEKCYIAKCGSFAAKCEIFEICVKLFFFIMLVEGGVGVIIYCQYFY